MTSLSQQRRIRAQESGSMPKKPFKIGKFSKKLIGRAIRVGYIYGAAVDGVTTGTDQFGDIQYFIPEEGTLGSLDSPEQIIALGEAKIELKF